MAHITCQLGFSMKSFTQLKNKAFIYIEGNTIKIENTLGIFFMFSLFIPDAMMFIFLGKDDGRYRLCPILAF